MTWITLMVSTVVFLFRLMGEKFDYIDTDLLKIQQYTASISSIVAGDYSNLEEKSHEEFLKNFQLVVARVEDYLSSPFVDKPAHAYVTLSRARDALNRVQLTLRKNFIRKQPFGIIVGGPPGSGKTFGLQRLCCELYKLDHGKVDMEDIVILNEGDQYQSEFQSHHKIVIFDDLGATKVNIVADDPFRKIIDFINNVPKTALNPHLDLKGIVWIEPHIVGSTTNLQLPFIQDQGRNVDSVQCPEALNRRFKLMVWQQGYDEFYIVPSGKQNYSNDLKPAFAIESRKLNYHQLFEYAKDLYLKHNKEQDDFVSLTNTLHSESANLEFITIVAFQQALRLFIGKIGFSYLIPSSLLVLCRRFLAIPLQHLKVEQRSKMISYLYGKGYSNSELISLIEKMESITRSGVSVSLLSLTKNERDLISSIVSIIIPICCKSIPYSFMYDLLTCTIPFVIGKIYDKIEDVDNQDPDAPKTHWPLSKFVGRSLSSMKEKLLRILPSRLKAESKLKYVTNILDVQFVEACLEEYNLTIESDFSLTLYDNAIVIHENSHTERIFSKSLMREISTCYLGISVSKDEFLSIRDEFYVNNPLKAEANDKFHPEFRYKVTNKPLKFWPRQFPLENANEVVEKYLAGQCSLVKCLNAMGGVEGSNAIFVPNFTLTRDYKFVRGRISLIYLKQTKNMYIILREKDKTSTFDIEILLDLFRQSCNMYAIVCPKEGTTRYVLPLMDSPPRAFQQDLTTIHRHYDVQVVLYGSAFARGTLFRYKTFFRDVLDKSICIENLEQYCSESEDSFEYSEDGEDCETVTSKGSEDSSLDWRKPPMSKYYDSSGNFNHAAFAMDL